MGRGGARTAAQAARAAAKFRKPGLAPPRVPCPAPPRPAPPPARRLLTPRRAWRCLAVAPTGFEIAGTECPPLDTEEQRKALIGQTILHAWDNATGG